jgi:hypothetical protein
VTKTHGEVHCRARLTAEQVTYARILARIGPYGTVAQLARRWGLSAQTLRQAIKYKAWQWLPPPTPEELEAASLPDWLDIRGRTSGVHCGSCVHWCKVRKCTMGIPEAGGFFAMSCAAYTTASILISGH